MLIMRKNDRSIASSKDKSNGEAEVSILGPQVETDIDCLFYLECWNCFLFSEHIFNLILHARVLNNLFACLTQAQIPVAKHHIAQTRPLTGNRNPLELSQAFTAKRSDEGRGKPWKIPSLT